MDTLCMCMCVCVCVCLCTHIYMCVCVCLCTHIYMCVAESLHCSPETITLAILQYKIKSLKNKNIGQLVLVPEDSHLPCVI